jgi:hypothetical protein
MKIYVAGSWDDRLEVKEIMSVLESYGHIITEDWTKHENPKFGHEYCIKDIKSMDECDVFIMFLSETKSFGKAFEMGYAHAKGKHIIVFGDPVFATSVFFKMSGTQYLYGNEILKMMFTDSEKYLISYLSEISVVKECP